MPDEQPFVGRKMGVELYAGPSYDGGLASTVTCYRECIVNSDGYIFVSYRVASLSGESRREVTDLLRVYLDKTGNAQYDAGVDPFRSTGLHILRPVNYVALGDSYSAGENGRFESGRFDGADLPGRYLTDDVTDNASDPECRRWSLAYSQVLDLSAYPILGDVTVETFACTGAIAYNVFRPDTVVVDLKDHATLESHTDRPSVSDDVPTKYKGSEIGDPQVNEDWEPRQAVSLGLEDEELSVDMVTVTIGGNDMRFASFLDLCVRGVCDVGSIPGLFAGLNKSKSVEMLLGELEDRLVEVYSELKRMTGAMSMPDREASIFVLGYPHLVPPESADLGNCDRLTPRAVMDALVGVYDVLAWPPISGPAGARPFDAAFLPLSEKGMRITATERGVIRDATGWVNERISNAARRAGVHFVDVSAGFEGHDQCSGRAWINGVEPAPGTPAVSDRSFHPNVYGHQAFADILTDYIEREVRSARQQLALNPELSREAVLTAAGLPVNPPPRPRVDGRGAARGSTGGGVSAKASTGAASGSSDGGDGSGESGAELPTETAILVARPATRPARCVLFAPGAAVTLSADGFAANSAVTLSISGASATATQPAALAAPSATAGADGRLEVSWTVPQGSPAATDAVPRWYFVEASGTAASGGRLTALLPQPIVAYPGTAPCASDDAATTAVGQSVRIAVLGNDVAPTGGSLDAASVRVESVHNADVVVDTSDGSLTYMPDAGFVGADTFRYWVYDNWGIGVRAEVTVVVSAGCTITGTAGVREITGTEGDDVICVPDPDDPTAFHIIDAKGGDDVILGGDGIDWIDGGPGSDTIYARRGADRIDGGPGADEIHGGRGLDTIRSGDFADTIHDDADDVDGDELLLVPAAVPAPSAPVLAGDEAYAAASETLHIDVLSNDFDPDEDLDAATLMIIQAPADGTAEIRTTADLGAHVSYTAGAADSAAGTDTFTYQACDRSGACSTTSVTVTVGTSGCTITGTDGDDTLSGTPGADVICGLGGNDVIHGLGGNDIIVGGNGDDTVYGGDGDDVVFGGAGGDSLYGGTGADVLWGGAGRDALEGNSDDDVLSGGPGVDGLIGGGGDDTLWGGPGGDSLIGHAGNDTLHGGLGGDTLTGGNGGDTLWGGAGADTLTGGAGDDTLRGGPGDDTMHGNTQNDTLWGGPGDDTLRGGGHDDTLWGDTGADSLFGNAGDDRLFGGWGDDSLDGGNGADYLAGGDDTDSCRRGETLARCET